MCRAYKIKSRTFCLKNVLQLVIFNFSEADMIFKKIRNIPAILIIMGASACTTALPEHSTLQSAQTQYEAQVKTAGFIQSYLNNPQTSIQKLAWWSTEAKVKERDININACLSNARLYNRLAPQFSNLKKSQLPRQLDESRCLPVCDGDSALDKTCYKSIVKAKNA